MGGNGMRVRVGTVLLLAWLPATAAAQQRGGVISGVVRDAEGRPLAQARVVVLPGARAAESGSDGRFEIRQLSAGTYRLDVSLIGYAPQQRQLRVEPGEVAAVELNLAATPLTLGGLQVTASTGARLPTAVTQATAQLSGRALDRELGGSIAQTLRNQPGVAVRSMGPGASMPVVRGLTGDRVLVLQDGQRTADLAGSADDHGVTIDPLAAQRVEVVRGPATLLYGNNALGGVVNVISGDVGGNAPVRREVAVALQTETAYPGAALSVRAAVPVGGSWAVTARAGARTAGDMRIAGGAPGDRLANTQMRSANAGVTLARVAPTWSGSMSVRAYDFRYGLPVPPDAEAVELEGGRLELVSRAELAFPSRTFPAARIDATLQDYGHDELGPGGELLQRFALGTGGLNLLLQQAALGPAREGAFGVSVLVKDYSATGPAALTPPATSRALGAFGFQEFGLGAVALQLGARVDRYGIASRATSKFGAGVSRTFDAVSGSAGLRLPLSASVTAGITAARSFRAPTVEELFSAAPHAGTGAVEFGDPRLREERGRSIEGVLHVRGDRVNGQFAAWVNRVDNMVQLAFVRDTVIGAATLPVFVHAQAPASLRGVEGAVELALFRNVAVSLRGDWLHTAQHDGKPLSFMPPPRLGAGVRREDGPLSLGLELHHDFARHRTGEAAETATAAHTILRADAGLRIRVAGRPQSISLRVDNLTNALYHEATSRTKDFAPAAGRNIALLYRSWF
jgi:iron complex outermembrane recepter protein